MATFRDSSITTEASSSSITFTIPALAEAGDLLVCFITKGQDDPINVHTDWEYIDVDEWSIGSRLSDTCMWKVATAADIAAGSWYVDSAPSASAGKVDALVVAYNISDWSGLVWNIHANGYKEGTAASSFVNNAVNTFEDGITVILMAFALVSRTGAGSSDHGSLRVESGAADTRGNQVYDVMDDVLNAAKVVTIDTLGTANTYHTIVVCFGPAANAGDFPPCPDAPDGTRTGF